MKKTISQIADEIAIYEHIDLDDLSQLETRFERQQVMRRAYQQLVKSHGSAVFRNELQLAIESLENEI